MDIDNRKYHHLGLLRKNIHPNNHLQKSWNKYGEDNFIFYILEICNDDELDELEIHYIDFYNTTNNNYGYNLKSGGQNGGSRYTDTSREKMSKSHKDLLKNQEEIDKLRQHSLKTWSNDVYRESRSGENHPMYGKHLSDEWKNKISKGNKGKKKPRTEEHQKKLTESIRKSLCGKEPVNKNKNKIYCFETDIIYEDSIDARNKLGLNSSPHILDVCNGKRNTCGGYHFKFIME